jgi:hypothetical protein
MQYEGAAVIQSARDRVKRPAFANTSGFHKMQEICRPSEQQSDSQLSHYVKLGIMIVDTTIGKTAKKKSCYVYTQTVPFIVSLNHGTVTAYNTCIRRDTP